MIKLTQIINQKTNKMKKFTLLFAALLAVIMSFATTVTKTTNALATELNWTISSGTDATCYTSFALDQVVTISTTGEANCGAVYGTDTHDWRLYQAKNGNVIVTAVEGYTLASVKFTYTVSNTGVLKDAAGNNVASGDVVAVNASNVTLTVGNSGTKTNGQVRITAFEVVYNAAGDTTVVPVDTTVVPGDTTIVPIVVIDTTEITCAQARELALALSANNQPTEEWYAVTGFITEVVGNVSRNQQTFWMADTLEGGRVFEGYWANLPESIEAFEVGMQVKMIGHLMKYNTTPEIKNGEVTILAMPVPVDTTSQDTTPVIVPVTMETLTFKAGVWKQDSAKFGAWVWGNSLDGQFTDFFTPLLGGEDTYSGLIPETADSIVFVRFADTVTVPAWGNGIVWNQTINYAVNHADMFFSMNDDWSTGVWGTPVPVIDTTAITCAQARELALALPANNQPTEEWYAVTGYITEVVSNVSRNQQTFWMADSLEGGRVFEGYWANLPDNIEAFEVGMQVTMIGHLMKYNTTPEIKNGEVIILAMPVIPEPVHYYIKNNWNGGDWAWEQMTEMPTYYEYVGVYGGNGVNINTSATDEGAAWFPQDSIIVNAGGELQALDTVMFWYMPEEEKVYAHVVGRPEPAPVVYYIKNNWYGTPVWEWAQMTEANGLYEYTGVWGGTGVNINTVADDYAYQTMIWISAEDFEHDTTFVPQAMDTLYFLFDPTDTTLLVDLIGRPAPAPVHYYIKNNWNGAEDWTWEEMTETAEGIYAYTGVWGGQGVNINTRMEDEGSYWAPAESWILVDSTLIPLALDTLLIQFDAARYAVTVEVLGRPVVPEVFQIKNNWNGGEEWTWEEMIPAVDQENMYMYVGVFGGTGVNVKSNYMADVWFPVENWAIQDSTFVPQAMDTIAFLYSAVDTILAAELIGRPEPEPEVFFIKNNWNGAAEWTYEEMIPAVDQENMYMYVGVFGGTGVNVKSNYMADVWFPVENWAIQDSTFVPQAMDTIAFLYSAVDTILAAELIGRPEPVILDSVSVVLNITDLTGWATLNVYAWGGAEIFGAWPGMIVPENGIITIEGAYAGMTENLIFNNGQGTQLADLAIAMVDTTYEIIVRLDGAYFADQLPTTNTCAEVNAITENTNMVLGEVSVVFVKGAYVYVEDATATTLVYTNWYGDLKPGDRVQGIAGTTKLYNGLPELVPATPFADLVVTEGEARAIKDATAAPTTADINKVLMFRNVAMPTASYAQGTASNITGVFEGEDVIFRNGWKEAYDFDSTKTYTMLGCVGIYNGTIQVLVTNFEEYVPVEVNYYIKNNWNRGADWTWMDMIPADDGNLTWMYTGIFGGTGVNINTAATDENALWFPIDDMIIPEGNEAPEAGDSVMFVYNTVDNTVTATVLSQVIPGEDITVTVWVRNENTNWEHLYVYGWGGAEEIFGAWPGMQLDVDYVLEADRFEYTNMFHITGDFEGLEENLIFNNGQGGEGNQFPDLKILLTEDAEYFIVIDNEKAYFEGGEGLEEVVSNAKNETTKVIMNGQLYIIRDGKVYNALGAQVR